MNFLGESLIPKYSFWITQSAFYHIIHDFKTQGFIVSDIEDFDWIEGVSFVTKLSHTSYLITYSLSEPSDTELVSEILE